MILAEQRTIEIEIPRIDEVPIGIESLAQDVGRTLIGTVVDAAIGRAMRRAEESRIEIPGRRPNSGCREKPQAAS